MSAVAMVQAKLAGKTDEELLTMGKLVRVKRDENDRIISAAITEELVARHPELMEAVNEWGEDLETELDLIDVIADGLAA